MGSLHVEFSIDEIISTLNRSSLPTIIIEGKDDAIVYRKLEEEYADLRLSVFSAGGRDKVLKIFERRDELKRPETIAYIVDRDSWIYSEVPAQYICDRFLITAGYSIENEIISDGEVLEMMTIEEREKFFLELKHFVRWYALALHRNLSGKDHAKFDFHPDHVMSQGTVKDEFLILDNGEHYPEALNNELLEKYLTHLRGKSLLALMLKQLSYPGRVGARHNDKQLMETVKARPGKAIAKIFADISNIFSDRKNVALI